MTEWTVIPVAEPERELPPVAPGPERASLAERLVILAIILVPLAGAAIAPILVWGRGFGWTDLGVLVGMYMLTGLAITVGFHRLFVHRSFATYTWMKVIFGILGSMAVQGSLFQWVSRHRRHHQHSDTPEDPHTPHHHGKGVVGLLKGFWHAHIGWFFDVDPPDFGNYIKDLSESRTLRVTSALCPVWVALGLAIPAAIGGVVTQSWGGAWTGFLWGGLVRIFIVHHVTWSVNSACHIWGVQPYGRNDESRNNFFFGVLALGEGWHNAHHAFPTSARLGLRWWQIDMGYWVIRAMELLGLAWNVKVPTQQAQDRAMRGVEAILQSRRDAELCRGKPA